MNYDKNKIIIVEGKNDLQRIKYILPDVAVLTTNGIEVSEDFLSLVKKLSVDNEIILFLDPDYSGEKIRRKIMNVCPDASHIFVDKNLAISKNKKKIGVEHLELQVLKDALKNVKVAKYSKNITIQDLYELDLAGSNNSKDKRHMLCKKLNIGYTNAKQLVERLNLFNYTVEEIKEML